MNRNSAAKMEKPVQHTEQHPGPGFLPVSAGPRAMTALYAATQSSPPASEIEPAGPLAMVTAVVASGWG